MNAIPVYSSKLRWVILAAVFSFLYLPILLLIIYSFNESRLVTVWSGFSTKWYVELFKDELLMNGVKLSLFIAAVSATFAVILGTMSSFILQRFGKFKGETGFAFMITAPLVMPDVITGLSLLLLFISLGGVIELFAQRGLLTILIAHITFSAAYVTIVVSSRLQELDNSIEEAALDLGATPFKTFFLITLPMIFPALVASWLMAFTLSLDDLIITSFVSGPNSSTLPLVVYSKVRLGISPTINALATLMVLAVSVASFIAWWFMTRAEKKRRLEMKALARP
ncbi:ABC transporter permease subunit [Reinekea thalattae]|uniref:ABC transporter permease subunit n=1 Tax=Reinekea thalattae TaxID=2593301 RepID=A0A5C8ZCJ1_9GAMM|nr:ABC transporter permease subunit [Reinekea thalattae]TXR54891.1 ABC transporter permease subunit [Reinekea thalattae]